MSARTNLHPLTLADLNQSLNWDLEEGCYCCGCEIRGRGWYLCQYHDGYDAAAEDQQKRLDEAVRLLREARDLLLHNGSHVRRGDGTYEPCLGCTVEGQIDALTKEADRRSHQGGGSMSSWGRCQDALHDLYEQENGYDGPTPGPVKKAGVTAEQWQALIEPIIEAVYPIAYGMGEQVGRRAALTKEGDG